MKFYKYLNEIRTKNWDPVGDMGRWDDKDDDFEKKEFKRKELEFELRNKKSNRYNRYSSGNLYRYPIDKNQMKFVLTRNVRYMLKFLADKYKMWKENDIDEFDKSPRYIDKKIAAVIYQKTEEFMLNKLSDIEAKAVADSIKQIFRSLKIL